MDSLALSKYIVSQFSQQSPDGVTPMKLQKLLYYVKVWTLIAGYKFIQADFEHWSYGPVNKETYYYYRSYGRSPISLTESEPLHINDSQKTLIDFIVENYILFDAFSLSAMTHKEEPWKNTQENELISDELIKLYYSKQRFAKNFQPFNLSNNPFYPLDSYSFIIDMAEKDAEEITVYDSYEIYKIALSQAEEDFNSNSKFKI